jgi:branched-chain amino acid transport system permease protein
MGDHPTAKQQRLTSSGVATDDASTVTDFYQDLVLGIGIGALDALLAMGIVLIYRTTGVLNFAQAATGALSAYVAYSISAARPLTSLWLAIPAALLTGGIIGVGTFLAVSHLRSRQIALTSAVATLAVAVLLQQIIRIQYGSLAGLFPSPLDQLTTTVGGVHLPGQLLGAAVLALSLALLIGAGLKFTRVGTMVRALADNRDAARLCGANTLLLTGGVWALAGMLAALSGIFAAQGLFIEPSFLDTYFVAALIAAVIGGLRSLTGAFAGAVALEIAKNMFQTYAPTYGQYAHTFLLLLLVAVLVAAPRRWLAQSEPRAV